MIEREWLALGWEYLKLPNKNLVITDGTKSRRIYVNKLSQTTNFTGYLLAEELDLLNRTVKAL